MLSYQPEKLRQDASLKKRYITCEIIADSFFANIFVEFYDDCIPNEKQIQMTFRSSLSVSRIQLNAKVLYRKPQWLKNVNMVMDTRYYHMKTKQVMNQVVEENKK